MKLITTNTESLETMAMVVFLNLQLTELLALVKETLANKD